MVAARRLLLLFWLAAGAALLGGFAGALHPMGDSLSVFRPHLAAAFGGLSVVLLATGLRRAGVAGLAATVLAAATLVPPSPSGATGAHTLKAYQKNLLWILRDPDPIVADIRDAGADVVFLQEVQQWSLAVLEDLEPTHPHRLICPFSVIGGTAIVSRFPPIEGTKRCVLGRGFAAMQVAGPDGPLWLVSLHLHWPWPHQQPEDLATLSPVLQDLGGPVLIGGDFNMVPWSHTVAEIGRASRTRLAGGPGATYSLGPPFLGLSIDHILMPEDAALVSVERRPRLGSDHLGVLATIALP